MRTKTNSFILICAVLTFSTLFAESILGQPAEVFRERTKLVKEKYDFANWEKETGKVISGVAISEEVFPQLRSLRKVWPKDNYSLEKVQETTYTRIRQWWRSEQDEFEVTMVVGPTLEATKQYLILRYAVTQREPPLIKPAGRRFGLNIGNICFVTTEKGGEEFTTIDFIRYNILFMMRAEGVLRKQLRLIAEGLDALMLKKKMFAKYEDLPDLPTVKTFSAEKTEIKLGEDVPLILKVNNPQQRDLRYFWMMTGGGVEKDLPERFVYHGGEKGKQHVTVTVVNDLGLYSSKSLDIKVVQP
jgi:hypothetical protein